MKRLTKKFWVALVLFGLMGQVAWVVENMYLNVFIYKMFNASAANISAMVSASSIAATLTTILIGALSDHIGKRKVLICGGYLVWGISILSFGLVRMDVLTPMTGSMAEAAALGISLVIILDCIMTFFGSAANDAAYNAWITDVGNEAGRGKIEGINAMMPLIAILVVFGGFMGFNLDESASWVTIFTVIGAVVIVLGIAGFFLIDEVPVQRGEGELSYLQNVCYSFRPATFKEHKMLYAVIGAFAIFNISINTYMPYLIVYYEKSLGMSNYVLIFAPAIILAAIFTAVYGSFYDQLGFQTSVWPCVGILMAGYTILYFSTTTVPVFIGSLLMMCGYLSGMAIFGAKIRDHIPEHMSGRFQGVRIIGQVLIPGVLGPSLGAFVLRNAEMVENNDGTFSFLPNKNIWLAAFVVGIILCAALKAIFYMVRMGHYELFTESGEKILGNRKAENVLKACNRDKQITEAFAQVTGEEEKEDNTGLKQEVNEATENQCEISCQNPWNVYPRPQLKRERWCILDGNWTLNGKSIRMPFPPQSMLASYEGRVGSKLLYETTFSIPKEFDKDRILLHFGAVDQIAEVYVNGSPAGKHEGGYLPFSLDITAYVKRAQENKLEVHVTDTLDHKYPYGKQCKKRGGMWYTPVSGIWQTVWMENVSAQYIESVKLTPDMEGVQVKVQLTNVNANANGITCKCSIHIEDGTNIEAILENGEGYIRLADHVDGGGQPYTPKLWDVDSPYLYNMTVDLIVDNETSSGEDTQAVIDTIQTYFALRKIDIQNINGVNRVCLNDKPIFLHGVLDQGYFSDGIFLPAEPKEYERDILRMKELGLNMLRKHIKIEPECFYYYCDKHGMLVVQDMVNNGGYSFLFDTALPTIGKKERKDVKPYNETRRIFKEHMKDTLEHLYNHPCIVLYTIFNEGWGQFNSDEMYHYAKSLDDTRLYDATSGWFAQKDNDFDSEHIYFKTTSPIIGERPMFVSECGGYSQAVDGHVYSKYNSYGYGGTKDSEALTDMVETMYREMILGGIAQGICGCVYTQLSDVEDEINGFYTYDRKVCKVNKERMQQISAKLYGALENTH